MRVLIDATCPNGHTKEYFVENTERTVRCKECSLDAQRVVSPIRSVLDPIKGDFAGATLKWARHHEKMAQKTR